jgi:flavin-dependent dehydrogenase
MRDADVIIVGFRCAGAPLAYALQRAGVKVIVVDKSALFSDQPVSTHAIQPYGMKMLDPLGLGEVVRALAPPNRAFRFQVEDSFMQVELDGVRLDSRSPRRCMLDPALQQAALDAGVEARPLTRVVGLLADGGRVDGVRVSDGKREYELRAPLVVGADGRNSSIAQMVGAPTYLEAESNNGLYWSYFEQTPLFTSDARYRWGACIHIEGRFARAVFQTDSNLLLMASGGPREVVDRWRSDPSAALWEQLRGGRLTAPLLEGSRMVSQPVGVLGLKFFIRQAVGPGWALAGDAGLHMDPTPGLGIADAVRDAVALSAAITEGSEKAMQLYWRRRDADSIGLYHFAAEMGAPYYNNPLTRMMFDRSHRIPAMQRRMQNMMARQILPQNLVPPHRMLGWLLAESTRRNFASWHELPRALRFGRMVMRQQAELDRAVRRVEGGDLAPTLPVLN